MVAGLQGAGKTTSIAKLARYLKERENKKVLVVIILFRNHRLFISGPIINAFFHTR
jgi:signal recognition particle GTPase